MQGLPEINARYWLLLLIASVCGTNLGDLASDKLGLGFLGAFAIFSVIFLSMAVASRRIAFLGEAYYWVAIVVSRAGATDVADFATHQLRLSYPALIIGSLAVLVATLAITGRLGQNTIRTVDAADGPAMAFPTANAAYWTAMILANAFGTIAGDYLADELRFGVGQAMLLTAPAAAVAVMLRVAGQSSSKFGYWAVVLLIRAVATNLGDYLADGLGLGFSVSCGAAFLLLALLILALLTSAWPRMRAAEAR
ncbi:hypothetical protein K9U39_01340 [Rhodoblastus acidophilus]|uniref:Membrane-anchored protein n=1 Tax=Candidatus Rhodoblastus alkanivorans TaxID=2954117 RepID=A0ABS9Z4J2_9HYPH|nr:hypothetical protein [Candidatus Rhodoblastus alkanivorans]MCI4680856.1 hypothetical protein [Candidatus Rhodoblastus alkanivorans]MCI4682295.1 hypothetical protein [Candidatus Rhodoblastus alkanivorans]MDI4639597.1 hypothetical protein [Rhodoblastus acidophilus]